MTAFGTVGNQRYITVHDSTITAATAAVTFGRFATKGNIAFGASTVVDTIGFYGNATQVIPAGTYGFLFIGDGATPTLGGNINTTSDLDIKGTFTVGGNTVHVGGIFQTLGSTGVLVMNNASDNVQAAGVVNFYGGAESGSLTAGTLSVGAAFNQNVTANSFDASGTNTVVFNGGAFNGINIANPFTSRFQNVTVSTVGGMGLGASNSVTVLGNLVLNTGLGGAPGSTITIGGTLTDPGGLLGVANVTFTGSAPISASTPAVTANGANGIVFSGAATLAGPVTFNLNGAVSVTGGLTLAGYITHVNGNFSTTGTGTLTMTNALDSLVVKQNANFGGGSEVGLLTRGALVVSSFTQSGPTATSFAADSTHKTYLLSLVPVGINFANPGTGAAASHFGTLIVETGNNIVLQSDV